jgi:hypothetical protein
MIGWLRAFSILSAVSALGRSSSTARRRAACEPTSLLPHLPSVLTGLAVKRWFSEQLSAHEIFRSHEGRCDELVPMADCARSLIASPPFPVALAVLLLSFLRLILSPTRRQRVSQPTVAARENARKSPKLSSDVVQPFQSPDDDLKKTV